MSSGSGGDTTEQHKELDEGPYPQVVTTRDYFGQLFGFDEFGREEYSTSRYSPDGDYIQVTPENYRKLQSQFELSEDETMMKSKANGRRFQIGKFKCLSTSDLALLAITKGLCKKFTKSKGTREKSGASKARLRRLASLAAGGDSSEEEEEAVYTPSFIAKFDGELMDHYRCKRCTKILTTFLRKRAAAIQKLETNLCSAAGKKMLMEQCAAIGGDLEGAKSKIVQEVVLRIIRIISDFYNVNHNITCELCVDESHSNPKDVRLSQLEVHTASSFRLSSTSDTTIPQFFSDNSSKFVGRKSEIEEMKIGSLTLSHVVTSGVMNMHCDPLNKNAIFQVASQFNTLEFMDSNCIPEHGIGCYRLDNTQGPRCAIATAPSLVYRNYLYKFESGKRGQKHDRQINNIDGLLKLLGEPEQFVSNRNGYIFSSKERLKALNKELSKWPRRTLLDSIHVGWLKGAEVACSGLRGGKVDIISKQDQETEKQVVSQVYCAAINCAYANLPRILWRRLSKLALDAAYEAVIWAGVINAYETGCNKVFLTMVGGGVFGNKPSWIADAIARAITYVSNFVDIKLDISLVHFRKIDQNMIKYLNRAWKEEKKCLQYLLEKYDTNHICRLEATPSGAKERFDKLWEKARIELKRIEFRDGIALHRDAVRRLRLRSQHIVMPPAAPSEQKRRRSKVIRPGFNRIQGISKNLKEAEGISPGLSTFNAIF